MANTSDTTTEVAIAHAGLCLALAVAGYEPSAVEIDLVGGSLLVELHRVDGRWLRLSADRLGRVSLERWQRRKSDCRPHAQAPVCMVVQDEFLGRFRPAGLRAGLRALASYVADNPAPGRLGITGREARDAMRLVMS